MRVYTVHIHPRRRDADGLGDRDVVLVKEGFCWPALFFSVIWAIWKGLWLVALLFLLLQAALNLFFNVFLVPALTQAVLTWCWRSRSASSPTTCAAGPCPAAASAMAASSPGAT
jgi:hypothetical protein